MGAQQSSRVQQGCAYTTELKGSVWFKWSAYLKYYETPSPHPFHHKNCGGWAASARFCNFMTSTITPNLHRDCSHDFNLPLKLKPFLQILHVTMSLAFYIYNQVQHHEWFGGDCPNVCTVIPVTTTLAQRALSITAEFLVWLFRTTINTLYEVGCVKHTLTF